MLSLLLHIEDRLSSDDDTVLKPRQVCRFTVSKISFPPPTAYLISGLSILVS